jgi:uncharacterized membrane protein YhaH (DUF805 family)
MYSTSPSDTAVSDLTAALGTFMLIGAIIYLAILVLVIIAWWKIASKAGYSGAWALIMFIPFVNFIFFLIFAFGNWPVLQELEQRRMQGGVPPNVPVGAPYPPQQY